MELSVTQNPFPIAVPRGFDLTKQSEVIAHPPSEPSIGRTGIYVNAAFPPQSVLSPGYPRTAYELFNLGLRTNPEGECLGRREWDEATGDWARSYVWDSYRETAAKRDVLASGIKHLVGATDGIKAEWQQIQLGLSAQSIPIVSLYDTLGPTAVHFCLQHAEISFAFVSATHLRSLLELAGPETPLLKTIVCVDLWTGGPGGNGARGSEELAKTWGREKGVEVLDLEELFKLGREFPSPHNPPGPSSIGSICYTSGTTGNPKGAIILHGALAASAVSQLHGLNIDSKGSQFSYLPLSHIFERLLQDMAFCAGAAIGYSCGDNLRLLEDLQLLQPTVFVSVPRVLNRIYQSLKAATVDAPGFKGVLLRKAFADKAYNLQNAGVVDHAVWDRVAFKKVRELLGGRISCIISGSAPIAPEVLDFFKIALSSVVVQGYGQTENNGTACRVLIEDSHPDGSTGPPTAGVQAMLMDVPEMGYFSTDKPHPRGEICTRSPCGNPGYFKDPAKSAEAVDSCGWLHTGDIGLVDDKGRFRVIDRIKNLVKLSQGEYVAVEKVENVYALCPLVSQIYIHGDSLQDHVVGVVVPDLERLAGLASEVLGRVVASDRMSLAKVANDDKVVAAVAGLLSSYAQEARLLGYERLNHNFHISLEPFTAGNDLLTPTFKIKRNVAAEVYKVDLARLYAEAAARKPAVLSKL
ncbi:hypothetical protein RQP46_009040 [Phenoliferia psychrophenolica]